MSDVETKELESIEQEERGVVEAVTSITVTSRDEYANAGEFLKRIKAVGKKITDFLEPNIRRWFEGHKKAKAELNERLKPLEDAERILKGKMQVFFAKEEEARRQAERAKREEEARQAQEREARARELLDKGEFKKAESVLNTVEVLPDAPEKVKTEGVAMVRAWKYRIVNPALVPDQYKIIDERAIGATVRTLKERARIPGVEIYSEFQARA